jgi:hypothetical protein
MDRPPKQWQQQGCPACRAAWESGLRTGLRYIGVSDELHARLYQCNICRAYWEELERYAHEISSDQASAFQRLASFLPNGQGG